MDWPKTTTRRYEKYLSYWFGVPYIRNLMVVLIWQVYLRVMLKPWLPSQRHFNSIMAYQITRNFFNSLFGLTTTKYQSCGLLALCEGNPSVTRWSSCFSCTLTISWHKYVSIKCVNTGVDNGCLFTIKPFAKPMIILIIHLTIFSAKKYMK